MDFTRKVDVRNQNSFKCMKKIIAPILILLAIYLGYVGITKFADSGKSVDIAGIELSTQNNQERNTSYLYLGFALVSAIGGIVLLRNKKS